MSDRAPDGQPTESIRVMLANAEESSAEWELNFRHHSDMADSALHVHEYWQDQVKKFQTWLDARLSDETQPHVPYLDN